MMLERDERPASVRVRTPWLEVPEAARLLWAAETYPAKPHEPEMHLAHPILATFLLTGGRAKEVLGLALSDVSFEAETVAFRPHPWHRGGRLKTEGAERVLPLWPQLREILEAYLDGYRLDRPGELLFPSPHLRADRPITDLRDMLDRVAVRAGFLKPVLDERTGKQARGANGRLLWTGQRIRTRPTTNARPRRAGEPRGDRGRARAREPRHGGAGVQADRQGPAPERGGGVPVGAVVRGAGWGAA